MSEIKKTIKSLEDAGSLIKGASGTIGSEAKEQKDRFLSMSLGTLSATLWGNLLTVKELMRAGEDKIRAGEGTIKAFQDL